MRKLSQHWQKIAFFAVGLALGLSTLIVQQPKPLLADVDRDADAKFAVVTVPLGLTNPDAIFVLDFLTGRLQGGIMNPQSGQFTQAYLRNIVGDFGLDPSATPRFVVSSMQLNISGTGQMASLATSGLAIAELNSGRVNVYGFRYQPNARGTNINEIILLNGFPFRQAS